MVSLLPAGTCKLIPGAGWMCARRYPSTVCLGLLGAQHHRGEGAELALSRHHAAPAWCFLHGAA